MLLFDNDPEAAPEKGKYPASSNASTKSQEKIGGAETGVLVTEEDNAVQEAKTRVGRLLQRTTAQLARWGLEVNGCVAQRSRALCASAPRRS